MHDDDFIVFLDMAFMDCDYNDCVWDNLCRECTDIDDYLTRWYDA